MTASTATAAATPLGSGLAPPRPDFDPLHGRGAIARARVPLSEGVRKGYPEGVVDLGKGSRKGSEWAAKALTAIWARITAYTLGDIPTIWSDPPTTLSDLVRYARHGVWIGPGSKVWRGLGVTWCLLVAIPITAVAYYGAWFAQRPGRFVAGLIVYAVIRAAI